MKNRTKIILGILLTTIAIALVLVVLFAQPNEPSDGGDVDPDTSTGFPLFGGTDPTEETDLEQNATSSQDNNTNQNVAEKKLFKITDGPIAGATAITIDDVPHIRYVEKARGFAYDVTISNNLEENRLTSNTIPQVQNAYWAAEGDRVVMQYLTNNSYNEEIIRSYSVPVPNTPTEEGFFFPDNAFALTLSPDTAQVAYLLTTEEGAHIITSPIEKNSSTQVHFSPLKEWLLDWATDDTLYMTTKASHNVPGYLYSASVTSINSPAIKITGGELGLTTNTNSDGSLVLTSENSDNRLSTNLLDTESHTSDVLPLRTLAEKCVWGFDSEVLYCGVSKHVIPRDTPDSWYQGENQFSDSVWVYNTSSGVAGVIVDPETYAQMDIDIVNPFLSPTESHLFFTNKRDGSLWGVNLALE